MVARNAAESATAAEVVVGFLAGRGVRRCYCVPGESFLELIDAIDRHPKLELVSCRHESGAAFMAEADAKLTGVPAVVLATRAVGAANAAIGVHTARQDRTPMLVLLGQVPTAFLGREAFQEVDLPAFYREITVHAETVHRADRAGESVARAWAAATGERPGPAMLAFPSDVLPGACSPVGGPGSVPSATVPDAATLRAVDGALRSARAPVVIAGRGCQRDPGPLVRLAEHYGLGVYTAFRRQDAFPNSHPRYLGHLALGAAPELLEPLRRADLVLVAGGRLDEITTQSYTLPEPGTRIVAVDPAGEVPGAQLSVRCAVGALTDALLAAGGEPVAREPASGHQVYLRHSTPNGAAPSAPGTVHPAQVLAAMRRCLPPDAVLTNDAGNFAVFCHRYWRFDHPHTQLGPLSGAMGYAVPAAVGARLAAPERRVVALAGDGGFLMSGQELETAVRHGAPITVIVFVNRSYGTIALHQARRLGRTAAVDIGPVDIAAFARSLGAEAVDVRDAGRLDDALRAPRGVPRVVVVHTDPDVLTPGTTMSGLLGRPAEA